MCKTVPVSLRFCLLVGWGLFGNVPTAGAQWYDDFQNLASIYQKLGDFEAAYPELVTSFSIGSSYEGREIRGLKISGTGGSKATRPAVLLNSGQHAREWIAPLASMYAAEQLLGQYDSESDVRGVLDEVDFYVIPVVNPDGYHFSWGSPSNRFWRLNRRQNANGSWGVDLNRNWDYGWGGGGSSGVPGSETYRGTAPFSEPETAALRDFYYDHPNLVSNIDFHSFSQLILTPFGYSAVAEPADHALLMDLAAEMSESMAAVHGQTYVPQSASELYQASGISIDWSYGSENVYSYTVELRPAGPNSVASFELPASEILPTVEEAFAAVLDLGDFTAAVGRGDFNYDYHLDLDDLDALAAGVVLGTSKGEYDVNGDALIDPRDVQAWLVNAGQRNQTRYRPGDANLDGAVDHTDFDIWSAHQNEITSDWSRGDFNVDGLVDGADWQIWQSSVLAVPEPTTALLLYGASLFILRRR